MIMITNKLVRDLSQQIKLNGNIITVISKIGRKKVNQYSFSINEWNNAQHRPSANKEYNYRQLISKKFRDSTLLNDIPEGECITERLIDAQINGIKAVIKKNILCGEK